MPDLVDLDGSPANESCAQLGVTADFHALNKLEVDTYRAAIIAVYGAPPAGYALRAKSNAHDFGSYITLVLASVPTNEASLKPSWRHEAMTYAEAIENGLDSWVQAGFQPPVSYDDLGQMLSRVASSFEAVVSALITLRPTADGSFPVDGFAALHANLTSEFLNAAAEATRRLAGSN